MLRAITDHIGKRASARPPPPMVVALIALSVALGGSTYAAINLPANASGKQDGLWRLYYGGLRTARYIDLTHRVTPRIPGWKGYGPSFFSPTVNPLTGQPYTYASDGFEAASYRLSNDRLGTQLDPPAHWATDYPAIDELPATYAVRPLVVISIVAQVSRNFNYALQVSDIRAFEKRHGRIPAGSVVFVRSDWSKRWSDPVRSSLAICRCAATVRPRR